MIAALHNWFYEEVIEVDLMPCCMAPNTSVSITVRYRFEYLGQHQSMFSRNVRFMITIVKGTEGCKSVAVQRSNWYSLYHFQHADHANECQSYFFCQTEGINYLLL